MWKSEVKFELAKEIQPARGDYVIKRKRRHPMIDPCLGFYLPSSSHPSDPLLLDTTTAIDYVTPCTRSFDKTEILTVDAFLRKAPFPITRGNRKKRYRVLEHNLEILQESSLSPPPHAAKCQKIVLSDSESSYCPTPPKRRTKRIKQARPLAVRLYEAAVLTHADPIDELVPDYSSRRPALRFVPEDKCTSPVHKRSVTLVDPRKMTPFRSCSFYPTTNESGKKVDSRQPVTYWRKPLGSARTHDRKLKEAHISSRKIGNLQRSALDFIPFGEAEAAYSTRRQKAK
ncbi:hypothetical protein BDQ17DRAFT_470399 [Cyathus striatus]|nr:hypothetical protein BDQ17DRAFT_470399 [Cyathus striatus]